MIIAVKIVLLLALFGVSQSANVSVITYDLPVGTTCDPDSNYKCQEGLYCEDELCKIGDGGDCTIHQELCITGKKCVGKFSTSKKCKTLMPPGGECKTDPYWFCEESLMCVNNICKIPENGDCTSYPDQCKSGLSCVGKFSTSKKCKTLMPPGGECKTDPYWFCEESLMCVNNICKIPENGDCTSYPDQCKSGLSCVGKFSTSKKCKTLMPPGGECKTDPYWFCEESLMCVNNICKIPENGDCTSYPDQCKSGLSCVDAGELKKCKLDYDS